jgi:hypothetical protein
MNFQKNTLRICMDKDKEVVIKILACIKNSEPCSVVSMKTMSEHVTYLTLVEKLKSGYLGYKVKALHATTHEELNIFLSEIENDISPLLIIVYLSTNQDESWFVEKLDLIRKKRSVKFVSVILTTIREVFSALEKHNKILVRSMFIALPVDLNNTIQLVNDFEDRFGYKVIESQLKNVYKWSCGHIGLTKALYVLLKNKPDFLFSLENLLNEESILHRLDLIESEIPEKYWLQLLSKNMDEVVTLFFEKYGYLYKGKIFNVLLENYLQNKYKNNLDSIFSQQQVILMTPQEKAIYQFLLTKKNCLISREDIASIIWKEKSIELYSDWAIDQLISRIRRKIKEKFPNLHIITQKRQGFLLTDTSN